MCIFCKIVNNEIPSYKIYEDENFLAFLDISQSTLGHTLVVPKKHFENMLEADKEVNSKMLDFINVVTSKLKNNLQLEDFNIMTNIGPRAGQTVFHYHVHIIPRYEHDAFEINSKPNPLTPNELNELVNKITK